MSSGYDTFSKHTLDQTLKRLKNTDVSIFLRWHCRRNRGTRQERRRHRLPPGQKSAGHFCETDRRLRLVSAIRRRAAQYLSVRDGVLAQSIYDRICAVEYDARWEVPQTESGSAGRKGQSACCDGQERESRERLSFMPAKDTRRFRDRWATDLLAKIVLAQRRCVAPGADAAPSGTSLFFPASQYPRLKSTLLRNSSPANHNSRFSSSKSVCRVQRCSLAAARCGVMKILSQLPKRALRWQRLLGGDVDRRAGDFVLFQSRGESGFIDERAARHVNHERRCFHSGKLTCTQQILRCGRFRSGDHNVISLRQSYFEFGRGIDFGSERRIASARTRHRMNIHSESLAHGARFLFRPRRSQLTIEPRHAALPDEAWRPRSPVAPSDFLFGSAARPEIGARELAACRSRVPRSECCERRSHS